VDQRTSFPRRRLVTVSASDSGCDCGTYSPHPNRHVRAAPAVHHPIRVAEDAATVDIISGGRLDLAVGPGSDPNDYATFGVPMRQRRPRIHEGLEIIRKCLTEGEFSFKGKYWNFENIRMTPKPVQRPLPLWVAAMFPKAIEEAGARGYHLASAPPAPLQKTYDDELRKAGYDPAQYQRTGLHIGHLATTHEKAWD
jgi:alkanesulfonate monooxygenase SsuD/methylene tetrahydromethanopterin reductase-like flavin-dependent oxidoreductase (luciferase family)